MQLLPRVDCNSLCVGTMIVIPLTACETVPFLNTDTAVFMFVSHGKE